MGILLIKIRRLKKANRKKIRNEIIAYLGIILRLMLKNVSLKRFGLFLWTSSSVFLPCVEKEAMLLQISFAKSFDSNIIVWRQLLKNVNKLSWVFLYVEAAKMSAWQKTLVTFGFTRKGGASCKKRMQSNSNTSSLLSIDWWGYHVHTEIWKQGFSVHTFKYQR